VDFEKLGVFYLGRVLDPASREPTGELLLQDARDLTSHAVIVGMTGSGKTVAVAPRKADTSIESFVLAWVPWWVAADGGATPAWR